MPPVSLDSGKIKGHSWIGSANSVHSTTTITADTWYYVVNTWDPSGLKIYVNGVLENTTTQTTYSASGASNYIWLAFTPSACSGDEGWFNGTIAEVLIFNRSLSLTEIQAQYNSSKYNCAYLDFLII